MSAVAEDLHARSASLSPEQQKVVAIHEAGHALAAHKVLESTEIILSMVPSTESWGRVLTRPRAEVITRAPITKRIVALLAGRAAEEIMIAACATCGGGMTLRAGTSRTGQIYRYYSCASAVQKGKLACKGRSIPMAKLDTLVTEHLAARLLQPERLTTMLTALAGRRTDRQAALDTRIAALTSEAEVADEKLWRLYELVEKGLAQLDDVLKDRIEALQTSREIALAALDRARSASRPTHDVSPAAVDRFARAMREKLSGGEIPFRKAYIRSIVDRIEVDDDCILIKGRKDVLEQAVLAEGGTTAPVVHSFVPEWRARLDSNQRPLA